MARLDKPLLPPGTYLPTATDDDKPVPIEVKMVVWVKRQGWQDEYSIDPTEPGFDFEDDVKSWFIGEVEDLRTQGEWPNVTEITE